MVTVLEARNLSRKLHEHLSLRSIEITVNAGQCFGIVGPYGCGKSALLEILSARAPFTLGELYVLGLNAKEASDQIKFKSAVVPQHGDLDSEFNLLDNAILYSSYFSLPRNKALFRIREVFRHLRLEDLQGLRFNELTHSQKRRALLAVALSASPEILFFDEPLFGVNKTDETTIFDTLSYYREQGLSVVVASSDMEQMHAYCDELALIYSGQQLSVGKPNQILKEVVGSQVIELEVSPNEVEYYLTRFGNQYTHQIHGNRIFLYLKENEDSKAAINLISGTPMVVRRPTIKDVFQKKRDLDLP